MKGLQRPLLSRLVILCFVAPGLLPAQTVLDIGQFEEDVRISNFLPSAGLGRALSVGDANGDGLDDLLAGAQVMSKHYLAAGGAFLIFGRRSLPRLIDLENPGYRVVFWGNEPQDYSGDYVSLVDFSGDGVADVFIAAPQYNIGGGNDARGKIYYLQSRRNWPEEIMLEREPHDSLRATILGERPAVWLGSAMAHGDFNGDGFGDLVVKRQLTYLADTTSRQPTVFILWGGQRLRNTIIEDPALSTCTILPAAENTEAVAIFADDLDRDGMDDLHLFFPDDAGNGNRHDGSGYVLWGKRSWPQVMNLSQRQNPGVLTRLLGGPHRGITGGWSIFGDFDGSGFADWATGFGVSILDESGFLHIYFDPFRARPDTFQLNSPDHAMTVVADGYLRRHGFPYEFAALDFDNDGYDDLAISNTLAYRRPGLEGEGIVYLLYGSPSVSDTINFLRPNARWDIIWGGSRGANAGESVTGGDLDGDGKDDLILGAWTAATNAGDLGGEIYVFLNRSRVDHSSPPEIPELLPASPNPFQATTVIRFEVAHTADFALEIYDLSGRRVRQLRSGMITPGRHTALWNGRNDSGNVAASGVYFAVLRLGHEIKRRKLLLVR